VTQRSHGDLSDEATPRARAARFVVAPRWNEQTTIRRSGKSSLKALTVLSLTDETGNTQLGVACSSLTLLGARHHPGSARTGGTASSHACTVVLRGHWAGSSRRTGTDDVRSRTPAVSTRGDYLQGPTQSGGPTSTDELCVFTSPSSLIFNCSTSRTSDRMRVEHFRAIGAPMHWTQMAAPTEAQTSAPTIPAAFQ
jgi:hypothetical protein